MTDSPIEHYLTRYAEAEARDLSLPGAQYDYSLVIPAYRESGDDVRRIWQQLADTNRLLAILVINSPDPLDESGRALASSLVNGSDCIEIEPGICHWRTTAGPDLLVVDRYTEGRTIPVRQGVGLARKLGSDIALSLIAAGQVRSEWLFTTDADASLPPDYFDISPGKDDVALVFPFHHEPAPGYEIGIQLYEVSMLYYVAGLGWSGSPYSYPTIGSTICCRADAYAAVRGYPRRSTGEDFYLLNKLRKIGRVRPVAHSFISLSGRPSERVPVGTGQTVKTLAEMSDPFSEFRLEHHQCFAALKQFLEHMEHLASQQPDSPMADDAALNEYMTTASFADRYRDKQVEQPARDVMHKHLSDWFDGLRTRQFIHFMRDHHHGYLSIRDLPQAPFTDFSEISPDSLDVARRSLQARIYR
jgi:hypothetical protein